MAPRTTRLVATFQLEIKGLELIEESLAVLACTEAIINIHSDVAVVITAILHPNVRVGLGGKIPHAGHSGGEEFVPALQKSSNRTGSGQFAKDDRCDHNAQARGLPRILPSRQ